MSLAATPLAAVAAGGALLTKKVPFQKESGLFSQGTKDIEALDAVAFDDPCTWQMAVRNILILAKNSSSCKKSSLSDAKGERRAEVNSAKGKRVNGPEKML